jgi:hypothetical protein
LLHDLAEVDDRFESSHVRNEIAVHKLNRAILGQDRSDLFNDL